MSPHYFVYEPRVIRERPRPRGLRGHSYDGSYETNGNDLTHEYVGMINFCP